jgi:hypothetical protein
MAEFVTKKENTRRLAIVIVCVLVDAVALAVGIYAMQQTNKIEKSPENANNIIKVRNRVIDLRKTYDGLRDNYLAYAKNIGWANTAAGTMDRFETGPLQPQVMKTFLDYWVNEFKNPQGIWKITKYRSWKGEGSGEPLYLRNLFEEFLAKEAEFKAKITDLETQIKAEKDKEEGVKKAIETENASAQKVLDGGATAAQPAAGLIGDAIRLNKEINTLQKGHTEELATIEKDAVDAQNKATDVKNENVRKRAASDAIKQDLKRRIYVISFRKAEKEERRDAAGEIISVNESLQLAYINLLRKDRLFKGTKFTVFSTEKGGQKLDKGIIEVLEVRDTVASVCAILKTNQKDWPIKVGDKLYNEMYEGGHTRYIAFAGRFTGRLSNEEASNLIRTFGDVYQDKVDEKTNYLVVAEGYEDHPNFAAAKEYGVKILREKILYDYLGVRRE